MYWTSSDSRLGWSLVATQVPDWIRKMQEFAGVRAVLKGLEAFRASSATNQKSAPATERRCALQLSQVVLFSMRRTSRGAPAEIIAICGRDK